MNTNQTRLRAILFLMAMLSSALAQNWSAWSDPVNLGPPVNGPTEDYQPFVTKDGSSIYFIRGVGRGQDIWVSHWNESALAWGEPEPLPASVNGPTSAEAQPFVTVDGHWLFFASNRAGGFGGNDLWVAWRPNKHADSGPGGWQAPVNLGSGVNSSSREQGPVLFEDENTGVVTLYFNSARSGNDDIYVSTLQPDGTFGPASPVSELNTGSIEQHPTVSHNGREIYIISDRPGSLVDSNGLPSPDIWVSTRNSTSDPWSDPEPAVSLNSPFVEGRPSLSFDGSAIYFYSAFRPGNVTIFFDIWKASRTKEPASVGQE